MNQKRVHDRLVFYANDMIFAEGDEGNWAYLIQSGKVEIYKTLPNGKELSLAVLGAGRLFGEMALIDYLPRMASARAIEQATLVLISNDILQSSLKGCHPLVRELIRNLSNNLRGMARAKADKASEANNDMRDRPYEGKLVV